MSFPRRCTRSVVTFLMSGAAIAVSGCLDQPTTPTPDTPQQAWLSAIPTQARDVPAVEIDLPPEPRPWDTSDAALVDAVAAEDGVVIIGFKERNSERTLNTGRRDAIRAATIEEAERMVSQLDAEVIYKYRSFGAVAMRIEPERAPEIRRHPLVDYVEPNQWYEIAAAPFRPASPAPQGQTTPWGISLVRAPEAWTVSTGSGVMVEMIDTGHDQGHEDLPYVPTGNCGGLFGGCDDGPFWHGTHVLGIFTARDNSIGVVGVAPGIAGSQTYVWGACSSVAGVCSLTDAAAGLDAGRWVGVKVVNMSFAGTYNQALATAVANAWAADIVLVAAAGNNGGYQTVYPAAHDNVIGVSGLRPDKSFAGTSPCGDSSNYGPHVDLSAPFWALSTVGNDGYEDEDEGWCGTSMAAPHVAGTAALVRSEYPSLSNAEVVSRLFSTAEDLGASGKDVYFGYGLVDAAYATGAEYQPLSVSIWGPTLVRPDDICSWRADASGGTGEYEYNWYKNYYWWVGSDEWVMLETPSEGGSFKLDVRIGDGVSGAFDRITVRASSSAPRCVQ